MPIHFLHQSVSFEELTALYAVSDVCLVSSTRDGMNLVSYEYIATQRNRHGVMILSEFAGAAQSLNGSLIVNPWNTEELAGAIWEAVTMGEEQREINFRKLEKYVFKYTSSWWGESFVGELERISELAQNKQRRSIASMGGAIAGKMAELGTAAKEAVTGKDGEKAENADEAGK
jgi:trehalose 6-phosphate synthase